MGDGMWVKDGQLETLDPLFLAMCLSSPIASNIAKDARSFARKLFEVLAVPEDAFANIFFDLPNPFTKKIMKIKDGELPFEPY
jgi:hypothetical protein